MEQNRNGKSPNSKIPVKKELGLTYILLLKMMCFTNATFQARWLEVDCTVLEDILAFLFLCVNLFNYMLAGLKISLNLRVSFG